MNVTAPDPMNDVIAAQSRLISALDGRSPDDIVAASAMLAAAISLLKTCDTDTQNRHDMAGIDHAMRQSDAARMRVNILSDWNRKRIDRLSELRGNGPRIGYGRP
jgi:hypothetical protein